MDGKFGSHTFRGVVDYQSDRSAGEHWAFSFPLEVDGVIGPQTWGRLLPDTIKQGDNGPSVRLAQWILKDAGVANWDPGLVDGDFGPNTKKAVTSFQTDNGIAPADGEVGPKTWLWLWG